MKGLTLRTQRRSQPQGLICQFCRYSTGRSIRRGPVFEQSQLLNKRADLSGWKTKRPLRAPLATSPPIFRRFASSGSKPAIPADPDVALKEVQQETRAICSSDAVPSDETVVQLLQKCLNIVERIVLGEQTQQNPNKDEGNATSSLLNLEEKPTGTQRSKVNLTNTKRKVTDSISQVADNLLRDEKVFISPEALEYYTKIQTLLKKANHFPEIFTLYANKPVPVENSSPVQYQKPNPKSVKNAVPSELANMALDVAIEQKNLPLVLAIIDSTFCAPAFYRAKIFKKATVPLAGLAAAPAASYVIASWASTLQNTMDESTARGLIFSAILAYVGFTSSVGIVAITSANDQMERVVWIPGVPLRQRWLREEERAALDKVAVAWGFKDPWMRGEEEGEEWEALREFIGMRGMILDKTDLMEGMQ
ncbi:hypothetical protein NFIA_013850 [Paecilomyces variotii No. 5]|uniref:Uncharacterized protein n=1 Tax=Byssochlamys spectabilis (strain No. 5 / NBRC 109023) TaxID=1356009 RepID=V5FD60_BYSSN|nr:hypothetical protein NFIA_013850 [Paecilomyces variotii No. 5]